MTICGHLITTAPPPRPARKNGKKRNFHSYSLPPASPGAQVEISQHGYVFGSLQCDAQPKPKPKPRSRGKNAEKAAEGCQDAEAPSA